jgi:hypothetical protein
MHVGAFVHGRLDPVEAEPGMASVVELKRAGTSRAGTPE